jgi:hypothetical protein
MDKVARAEPPVPRKPYATPRLQVYGTVEEITQRGTHTSVTGDNGMGKNNGQTGG